LTVLLFSPSPIPRWIPCQTHFHHDIAMLLKDMLNRNTRKTVVAAYASLELFPSPPLRIS
jgi:hypothetical protein